MFLLAVLVLTSLGALGLGAAVLRLRRRGLGRAVLFALEVVGVAMIFTAANVLVGGGLVLASRALTPWWLPFYWMDDVPLLLGSLLQALAFSAWCASGVPAGAK